MRKVELPNGNKYTLNEPSDLWILIRTELGEEVGDLVEGTMILSREELRDWWEMGCPLMDE